MRLVIRFLLSLSLMLLGGYTHTFQNHLCFSYYKYPGTAVQLDFLNSPANKDKLSNAASSTKQDYERIKAVEIEDDDDTETFRNNLERSDSHYFTFSYLRGPDLIVHKHSYRLPLCEHLAYSSSHKFILHRVILI